MCSETTQESAFLLEEYILEFNGGGKVVLVKEGAARIHFPTVFVVVPPETSWPVILQGEAERVDGPVTGCAISPLAMFIDPLSEGEFFQAFIISLGQSRNVRRVAVPVDH